MPKFDERDAAIVAKRAAKLDENPEPRVGDYVIFADGVTRRISHVWEEYEDSPASFQTSKDGSFYLGFGHISFSGSLYDSVNRPTLTLTDEKRDGSVWIFHHDFATAHNGVQTKIPFRVYRCSQNATS